jgi:hypothetical protein
MSAVLAWNNYAKTATITAGSAATNMPATNVAGDQGSASAGWQTAAGVLTGAAGAHIEVIPPTTGLPWRAFGLFGTNLTAAANVSFNLMVGGSIVWAQAVSPVAGYKQCVCFAPADTAADYLRINIDDPGNPDGFINVPLLFGGPAWFPKGSTGFTSTVGRDDSVSEVVTRGGQEYPNLLWQRRRWNIALDSLRAAETWQQADPLFRIAKAGGNVLFAPDTSSVFLQQEAIYGRLKGAADISYPYGGADRRRWQSSVTERL